MTIRESDLPNIGKKFEVEVQEGNKLVIVVHDDGRRELYHFYHNDYENCASMITLDDNEARNVAAIIGGLAYKPKALETVDVSLGDLIIEWYKIQAGSKCIGKSIGEMQVRKTTGASIIAVMEKGQKKHINPGVDYVFSAESTIVVVGERKHLKVLKNYLFGGEI